MIYTISPLEMLASFVLAFLGGVLAAFALGKYIDRVRRLALCEVRSSHAFDL